MSELWIFLCGLIIFGAGFCLGRKVGWKDGLESGLKRAPLEIKRISLEIGECVICGITKNFHDFAGKL